METNMQKVQEILARSDISLDEQEELLELFFRADDADLKDIAESISADPSLVKVLHENFRAKKAVIEEGGADEWRKIVEREEAILGSMAE